MARLFTHSFVKTLMDQSGQRYDAGETALFARQLEHVENEIYKKTYAINKAKLFIPVDSSVSEWAESYVTRQWDWRGMAKIITSLSDDLPSVDVLGGETFGRIHTIGNSFSFSFQDLRTSVKTGVSIETEKAEVAKMAFENFIEELSKFGDTKAGLFGFLNNPNVPLLSAPGTLNGDWLNPATTPAQILADLNAMALSVVNSTKNIFPPDTLLLPLAHYNHIAVTPLNDNTDTTILQAFIKNSPWVKNVDQWIPLKEADAAKTGPRAVCYHRDPKVVRLVIPMEFKMQSAQIRGLHFIVPCEGRIGGVSWRYPTAACYADLS